ncbi:MAG: hypothetical protein KKA97_04595 [Actinobacteria bacterium]|nr:hypothetical protein [Actinomycetota bacterium]
MPGTRYEDTRADFWDDPDFQDWPFIDKAFYQYLWTTSLSHGITGVYTLTARQIKMQTNLTPSRVAKAFERLGSRVRRYPGDWLWVVNRFRFQCKSPNHVKSAIVWLRDAAPAEICQEFWTFYANLPALARFGQGLWSPSEAPWVALASPIRSDPIRSDTVIRSDPSPSEPLRPANSDVLRAKIAELKTIENPTRAQLNTLRLLRKRQAVQGTAAKGDS